jgi:ribosomal protein S18 acetylase RimI-like enzyme
MMVSAEHDPRRAGTIWMLNLDESLPTVTALISATFHQVGPEYASELAGAVGVEASTEILKRFENGRRCYAAWVEDEIAAYGWVSLDEEFIGELKLRLKLLEGEAYIWDCATLPEFRQRHLYSALLVHILRELQAEGLCRVWIGADLENIASQRGIARAGFHHIADLVVDRVLALRQVWVQGQPDVPEHLVVEARRAFLNDRDKVWLNAVPSATQGTNK